MVVQTCEWKFKANIARSATFEGHWGQIFARIVSKMAKKLIIFKNFFLVSQSYSQKIDINITSVFLSIEN